MTTDEFEFGGSKHNVNDWFGLSNPVANRYVELYNNNGSFWRLEESVEKFNALMIEHFRKILEGKTPPGVGPQEIVGSYRSRSGVDIQTITEEGFRVRFAELVEKGLRYDVVKRVDDLANQCNASIRKAVYEDGPLEWKMYHSACVESYEPAWGKDSAFFLKEFSPIED